MRLAQELLAYLSLLTEAAFCLRGLQLRLWGEFRMLYSYVAYLFLTGCGALTLFHFRSPYYSRVFWFIFISYLLAEFAILAEISDHVFSSYPAIRYLGRAMVIVGTAISAVFVFAMLNQTRPLDIAILEFVRRTLIAKFAVILLVLLPARYYRIPINPVVREVLGGFAFFISLGVFNFGVRETLGMTFSPMFSIVGQSSFIAMLLIWTRALWNPGKQEVDPPVVSPEPGRSSAWALVQYDHQIKKLLRR